MDTLDENSTNVVALFPEKEAEPPLVKITEIRTNMRTLMAGALADLGINLTDYEIKLALKDPELAEAIDNAILLLKKRFEASGVLLVLGVDPTDEIKDFKTDEDSKRQTPNTVGEFDPSKKTESVSTNSTAERGQLVRFVSQAERNLILAKKIVRARRKAHNEQTRKNALIALYLTVTGANVYPFRKKPKEDALTS